MFDVDSANVAMAIGSMGSRNVYRQPAMLVIISIKGVIIIVAINPPATTQLIALLFWFAGIRSPISVYAIISTMTVPVPSRREKSIMALSVGARKLPIAENATNNAPIVSSDLCLNRNAKKPTISAVANSANAFVVLIWAAMPSFT